ncbi:MAG: dihydroneopterin aldolase [Prevotella sp.]|jgi:dihydroneopterin aldolase|nr:dihydroneopterin aldolase [Prevotella sp.]
MTLQTYIRIEKLRIRAFHGVLEQERSVGGDFLVSLRIGYPWRLAMESDNVKDTLDYAAVYRLVQREMAVPSQLLEHVAGRIVSALQNEFPQIMSIDLWLTKVTPPMGGDCEGAGVELHLINDKTD